MSDEQVIIDPTLERGYHDAIKRLDRPIISDPGEYAAPYIVVGLLEGLRDRNRILDPEYIAGDRFRSWFRLAQHERLKASDMARPYIDGGSKIPEPYGNERARKETDKAIRWVGGYASSSGSCLWHVIGLDYSLRKWALEQARFRMIGHLGASGILIAALESLARMSWYGPGEKSS